MSQIAFVLKRIALGILSLFAVITIVFLMFRILPGDPSTAVADPSMSKEARELILARYGLDEPLHVQFGLYLQNLLQGDMGLSFSRNEPVSSLLLVHLTNTLVLTLTAVVLAFLIGPLLGAYLAWNRNTPTDTVGIAGILVFYAAPVFWVGMIGIMVFSFQLEWLPTGGMRSVDYTSTTLLGRYLSTDFLWHLLLPLGVTTLYWLTVPALTMRNNMIDVLNADFIQLCRAEGLSEFRIMYRHAARNALLPVLHYWALAVGFAFGGSVILEVVFSWPGIGRLMWDAVLKFDYPLAQGAFIVLSTVIIFMNLIADILSVYVDPRVEVNDV